MIASTNISLPNTLVGVLSALSSTECDSIAI